MFKSLVTKRLAAAGITVGGSNPWDVNVLRDRFYRRATLFGELGVGDAYADGDFTCADLTAFLCKWLEYSEAKKLRRLEKGGKPQYRKKPDSLPEYWLRFLCKVTDQQDPERARRVGKYHYDLSPTLMRRMLGPSDAYTCAYFGAGAMTLDEAQEHKHRLIAEKLDIQTGDKVLDIGCGRGGLAKFLAEEYGAHVVGVTISREQWRYGCESCKELKQGSVQLELMDYRDIPEKFPEGSFNKVVSVGMFEHVGPYHYDEFFRVCFRMLKSGGMLLLHTIVGNGGIAPFIWYRVFPGGVLPIEWEIARAMKPYFIFRDGHEFGMDYARTLGGWKANCIKHWPEITSTGPYDERFFRMWMFYLSSCEAAFQTQRVRLEQVVATKGAIEKPYRSIRPRYASAEPTHLHAVGSSDRR